MDDDAFEEALESILPASESPAAAAAAAAAAGSAGRSGNGQLSAEDESVLDELLGVAPGERASGPAAAGQQPAPAPGGVTAGSDTRPAQPRSASPVKPAPSEYERQWAAYKQGAEPAGSGPSLMSAIFCCFRGATQVVQADPSRNSTGWPTLSASLLLRIGTEAGVGAWRWRQVCRQWKETLGTAPRIVRVQDLPLEELAGQIHFLIQFGRADWKLEAMGDKGAAGVAAAVRANEELCLVGVYRGRRKESVVGIRGASKLAIEINRGARLQTLDLNGSAIKQLGAEKLGRALVRQAEREEGCCLTRLGLARNGIEDGGLAEIAAAVSLTSTLTSLDLSSNYLTAEGCQLLGEASGADDCGLRTLVLRDNPIGPQGAALIGKVSPGRRGRALCPREGPSDKIGRYRHFPAR